MPYRLTWDTYKSNICEGFARFQQNEEFVDMTLAANGHLVKVHRNIIALASPYFKSMLQSAKCQHPVIFLHNVSHEILFYVLEYIYTGEAQVPNDMIDSFIETAKALSIKGVESIPSPNMIQQNGSSSWTSNSEPGRYPSNKQAKETPVTKPIEQQTSSSNFAAHLTINTNNYNLEVHPLNNKDDENTILDSNDFDDPVLDHPIQAIPKDIVHDIHNMPIIIGENENTDIEISQIGRNLDGKTIGHTNDCSDVTNALKLPHDSTNTGQEIQMLDLTAFANPMVNSLPDANLENLVKTELKPRYSISNRGALQLTLNRYLYYCHHQSYGGRKRRWRCVDYRRMRCPALIDMEGETIVSRRGVHRHPYHDLKICKKQKKELLFTSASEAEDARIQKTTAPYATLPDVDEDMKFGT